jgi:hypothetical protein
MQEEPNANPQDGGIAPQFDAPHLWPAASDVQRSSAV